MKLYELTEQYDGVMNLLYDGETDEQTILDTLESIEGDQRLLDVLPHALPPHVTKQLSMYHYEWYIANQLVTFNDALRALVGFRNRDASSRAYRSFFPAFSS